MLKRPIEGTKGPAQSALLMITHSKWRILRSWTDYRQSGSNVWSESVWSLFVCGKSTALCAGFLAFKVRMYLQH